MDSGGGRRRGAAKSSAEDQALDQIAKEVDTELLQINQNNLDDAKKLLVESMTCFNCKYVSKKFCRKNISCNIILFRYT